MGEEGVNPSLCRNCYSQIPTPKGKNPSRSNFVTPRMRSFFMRTEARDCKPIQIDAQSEVETDAIKVLQAAFNEIAGIKKVEGKDLINRSYNPVFDRWHIEEAWKDADSKRLAKELDTIRENIHTNLMERMFAVETYSKFLIKDGKLYSELLPTESFGQVILRGANWRAVHGSEETEREGIQGELGGWLKLNDALAHGEVGTKVISLSPPGVIKDSAYDGRYIDIYEVVEDKGEKSVKRTRIAVDFAYEGTPEKPGYKEVALALDPTFFDGYDGRPIDAWYLSRPVIVKGELPDLLLPTTAMSKDEFEALFAQVERSGLIDYYIHTLTRPDVDWKEVAKTFNTILNIADRVRSGQTVQEIGREIGGMSIRRDIDYSYDALKMSGAMAMVGALGKQKVKQVGGGGCPPNRGFDFTDNGVETPQSVIQNFLANSVGKFNGEAPETWSYHKGSCVVCNKEGLEVGPCNICKDCEKKF